MQLDWRRLLFFGARGVVVKAIILVQLVEVGVTLVGGVFRVEVGIC